VAQALKYGEELPEVGAENSLSVLEEIAQKDKKLFRSI
jgi:hypothetical protein